MKNLFFTVVSLCATLCYADNTLTKACDPVTACDPVVSACEPVQACGPVQSVVIGACEPVVTCGPGYVASSISCETRYIPRAMAVGAGRERHVERSVVISGRRHSERVVQRTNAFRSKTKAVCR